MRTYITFGAIILIINSLNAQEKFKLSPEGYNQPVNEFEIPQDSIYMLAINWVKRSFVDSDEVIQSTVENEMIRFQTYIPNGTRISLASYDLRFRFRIDIKENKYRIVVEELEIKPRNSNYSKINNYQFYHNKKGELKGIYVKTFKEVNSHLEQINQSLYDAISGRTAAIKDDW